MKICENLKQYVYEGVSFYIQLELFVLYHFVVKEEEEYDHRSLYERLKSQKDKAEADKAEQFKFSEECF